MVWFFVIVAALLAAISVIYWRWRRNIDAEVAEGAAIEWAQYQKNEPEFLQGMSEARFREVYAKVHTPRFPGYVLAMVVTFFASLPVTFALLVFLMWIAQALGLIPDPVEFVQVVPLGEVTAAQPWQCNSQCMLEVAEAYSGFYYFFGVLLVWLVIVAFFMRRFHSRRPGYLRDELLRARAELPSAPSAQKSETGDEKPEASQS